MQLFPSKFLWISKSIFKFKVNFNASMLFSAIFSWIFGLLQYGWLELKGQLDTSVRPDR